MTATVIDLVPRVAERIEIGPPPPEPYRPVEGGCWLWTDGKFAAGYGSIWIDGRSHLVHRVVYLALVGHIPHARPFIDHVCRVRACCNPDHLEPVTPEENMVRAQRPACAQGHLLEGDNLGSVRGKPNQRICRTCSRDRQRAYRARKAAA